MIAWRDALGLSRKRWQRKRIFGSLKYSAPLFLLTLLTIVTCNVCYVFLERLQEVAEDPDYPNPSHLRVTVPRKSEGAITPLQLSNLKRHPDVRAIMAVQNWVGNLYADFGEVRYAPMGDICGYSRPFFELYRTLPEAKCDPSLVPVLLGRDLLALSWSPEARHFVRDEQKEMVRWLGRTFTVYLDPLGMESYEPKFSLEQLDPGRFRSALLARRRQGLAELERHDPNLARRQDAVSVRMQVVGFIRDFEDSGRTCVVPAEIADRMLELTALRRGRVLRARREEGVKSVHLLAAPGRERQLAAFARKLGLEVRDRDGAGIFSLLYREVRDDPGVKLTLYLLFALYTLAMTVIIYQLLSGQVKDSIREIGLLRCIGARRSDVLRIFVVMNLVRLGRIYLLCLTAAYLLLLAGGFWSAGTLNRVDPEKLAKGSIPDFLIARVDHFTPWWLMAPPWMAALPLIMLLPVALGAAVIPILHAMGVEPSEALRD